VPELWLGHGPAGLQRPRPPLSLCRGCSAADRRCGWHPACAWPARPSPQLWFAKHHLLAIVAHVWPSAPLPCW